MYRVISNYWHWCFGSTSETGRMATLVSGLIKCAQLALHRVLVTVLCSNRYEIFPEEICISFTSHGLPQSRALGRRLEGPHNYGTD